MPTFDEVSEAIREGLQHVPVPADVDYHGRMPPDDQEVLDKYVGRRFDEIDCSIAADDPLWLPFAGLDPVAADYYLGAELLCHVKYLERGDMELEEKLNQLVDFLAHLEIPWQANDGVERLSLPQIRAICLFLDFASEQLIAEADEAARAATVWRKAWEILARGGLAEHAPPYKLE